MFDPHSPVPSVRVTAPRPWELESGFHDALYEWMQRAPWVAISAAAHLCLFFVLAAIPWETLRREEPPVLEARLPPPPPDLFELPPEPPPEVEVVPPSDVEPQLQDADVTEDPQDDLDVDLPPVDVVDFLAPIDPVGFDSVLGLGPGGAKYSGRGRVGRGPGSGSGTQPALSAGLEWLAAHQSPDGSWDADGFAANCGELGASACEGAGSASHDVGVTGLALLAFLGAGSTTAEGPHREVVQRGVRWLIAETDAETGLIGSATTHDYVYDHAIATLALCEAYLFSRSPIQGAAARRAVAFVQRARNPYGAWRYDVPPIGDADTSVTGWMVLALVSARDAGIEVDPAALDAALAWFDEVTDPATGRAGYDSPGSLSSRTPANRRFPPEKGESMTAVALLCRIFLGQRPADTPILERHAALLRRTPPAWDPEGGGCDMYYWYYGSYAAFQLGGEDWQAWRRAMEPAVLGSQREEGDARGSWDPVGPWGSVGGRVYSTALMTLCLEVVYRYGRVLGAR